MADLESAVTTMTTTTNSVQPLTTTFEPPAECTTDSYYISWSQSSDYTWWYLSLGAEDWTTCFPSAYEPTSYYSPGICPEGYTAAGQSYVTLGSNVETQATCCPSHYNAQTGDDWPWYTTNPCTSSNTDTNSVYSYTATVSGTSVASQTGVFGINAKGISIRWQSSDFASQTSTSTGPSSATGSHTTTATGGNSSESSSSGLSTGAKAGVGIGVAVGAILLIGVVFLFYRRRQKSGYTPAGPMGVARVELNAAEVHEIDSSNGPLSEMDTGYSGETRRPPVEMDVTR